MTTFAQGFAPCPARVSDAAELTALTSLIEEKTAAAAHRRADFSH
jgi:hypothetical protein